VSIRIRSACGKRKTACHPVVREHIAHVVLDRLDRANIPDGSFATDTNRWLQHLDETLSSRLQLPRRLVRGRRARSARRRRPPSDARASCSSSDLVRTPRTCRDLGITRAWFYSASMQVEAATAASVSDRRPRPSVRTRYPSKASTSAVPRGRSRAREAADPRRDVVAYVIRAKIVLVSQARTTGSRTLSTSSAIVGIDVRISEREGPACVKHSRKMFTRAISGLRFRDRRRVPV